MLHGNSAMPLATDCLSERCLWYSAGTEVVRGFQRRPLDFALVDIGAFLTAYNEDTAHGTFSLIISCHDDRGAYFAVVFSSCSICLYPRGWPYFLRFFT